MALTVEDQLEIQQLYAKYNHSLDFGRADDWSKTFTATGTFASGANKFEGTEALVGFANGFASRMKARHWTNNLMVEGDGSNANGTCYLQLLNLADPKAPAILTTAVYVDKLEKTADGWRFTERAVQSDAQ